MCRKKRGRKNLGSVKRKREGREKRKRRKRKVQTVGRLTLTGRKRSLHTKRGGVGRGQF